jgi:hypothetical protein
MIRNRYDLNLTYCKLFGNEINDEISLFGRFLAQKSPKIHNYKAKNYYRKIHINLQRILQKSSYLAGRHFGRFFRQDWVIFCPNVGSQTTDRQNVDKINKYSDYLMKVNR